MSAGITVGVLREALIELMELGGAWGTNMHESKEVLLRIGGKTYPLTQIAASFYEGRVVVMLDGRES